MVRTILITGAPGVGKTETSRALLKMYLNTVLVETDDLAQINPWTVGAPLYDLMVSNLRACIPNFIDWGAEQIIIVGVFLPNLLLPPVLEAISACGMTLPQIYCLVADESEIKRRIIDDKKPNDPNYRLGQTYLDKLARLIPSAVVIDTTEKTLAEVAEEIQA